MIIASTLTEAFLMNEKRKEPTTSKEKGKPSKVRGTKRAASPDKRISPVKQHKRRGIQFTQS